MKGFFSSMIALLIACGLNAQAPEKLSYQAVIRDADDDLVASKSVGIRISIIQGSEAGPEVYKEIFNPNPQTNPNGLLAVQVGGGIPIVGVFAHIDWANGPYFIKTETDPTGGTDYTITGTSQLLSVPYALFSASGTPGPQGPPGPTGGYTVHTVGEVYGGGVVFYVYDGGQHGLIAAIVDQVFEVRWYGGSNTNTRARGDGVGAGFNNTAIIIADQGSVDGGQFAATLCHEYSVMVDGVTYADWYLPSRFELNLMYLQKAVLPALNPGYYWSSTEQSYNRTYDQNFSTGFQDASYKESGFCVRAIRRF